jgi:hypothetical protein
MKTKEKIQWKENKYPQISKKNPIRLTIACIVIVYSIVIYISLKYPSPNDIYFFIGLTLAILIVLPISYYFINKLVIKLSPKKLHFSTIYIHFKYLHQEDHIKWNSIINITKDNTYPLLAWKVYYNDNQKMDLAMCDQEIIDEIRNRFEKR